MPSLEERQEDEELWLERHAKLTDADSEIDFQASYIRDLYNATDYPEFEVEKQGEIFKQWKKDKKEGIMTFREKSYRSTLTGTLAPELPKPWLKIMDDSLEHFLNITLEKPARRA